MIPLLHAALPALLTACFALSGPGMLRAQNQGAFDLRDGDRVVLVGDTLIERESRDGLIEFAATTSFQIAVSLSEIWDGAPIRRPANPESDSITPNPRTLGFSN